MLTLRPTLALFLCFALPVAGCAAQKPVVPPVPMQMVNDCNSCIVVQEKPIAH
jgi:hypothetical protein